MFLETIDLRNMKCYIIYFTNDDKRIKKFKDEL